MDLVTFLFRYAHILAALLLAGSLMFWQFVLVPAQQDADWKESAWERVRPRFAKLAAVGMLLLIVSGFYNYIQAAKTPPELGGHKGDGPYHMIMGIKMLLAFTTFFFAAALSGKSPKLAKIRENSTVFGLFTVILVAVIVALASYLKVRGVPVS